ncbi:hypothetical protein [Paenibacillus pini]|uniref:Uncharacterized protein n=1 Tax=Paenibacillus pini JCM 16418 TaxID=1236976 RepID=W7YPZ3_9BACL|nr:hypothetical protein [Paenibacillus pini]GAF06621.1 hypothetical protein JCM16418_591 [Paenibacillus pini JCM 16418]
MLKLGSFILELFRLSILFVLTVLILGGLEKSLYEFIFGHPINHWSMAVGNIIVSIVLYRNYYQFSGWYKSDKNKKLSRGITKSLMTIAYVLVLVPMWS